MKIILAVIITSADEPSAHSAVIVIVGMSVIIPRPIPRTNILISSDPSTANVPIVSDFSFVIIMKPSSIVMDQSAPVASIGPMFLITAVRPLPPIIESIFSSGKYSEIVTCRGSDQSLSSSKISLALSHAGIGYDP